LAEPGAQYAKRGAWAEYKTIEVAAMKDKSNKMTSTANNKREDGTFHSKKIKHDPNAESARAVFGKDGERGDKYIKESSPKRQDFEP
jgi:hypothetical protein